MFSTLLRILITTCLFIILIIGISSFELYMSHKTATQSAHDKTNLLGFLVSEWIAESFSKIKYILQDIPIGIEQSQISFPATDLATLDQLNKELLNKANFNKYILFLGVFNSDCVATHASIASHVGDDTKALGREYCTKATQAPLEEFKISNFFVSTTDQMAVTATYPIFSPNKEFIGFSAAGIDLSFFQKWLNNISDPNIIISIFDENQILLARKPITKNIGKTVDSVIVKNFLKTSKETINLNARSPIDDIDRIWSFRRIHNLPFMVVVGYPTEDVLSSWYTKLFIYIIGCVMLAGISLFSAVVYYKNRCNAVHLEKLLSELQKSAEQHQSILQTAMDGFWLTDIQGQLLEVSETYCQMSGYSETELLEMRIADVEAIDTTDYIASRIQDIIKKGAGRFQSKHKRKNGSVFDVEVSVQYREEDGGRFVCFLRDISDSKQAEKTLAKNLESLKLGESVAGLGYFERNWVSGEGFWSEGFYRLLGETPDDIDCTHAEFIKYVHPDEVERVSAHIRETLETRTFMDIEFRLVQAGGDIIDIHGKGRNSYDESGKPLSTIGTFIDITGEKKAEEEKRRLEDKLQQAQRMESIGTLAGGIAHNFNNLLMGIQGNASIIFLDINSSHPRHKNLKNIEKLVENGAKLAAQLIGYAREGKYEVKPINLNQLVEETSDTFRMTKKEITVHQELSEDLHGIEADQGQIEQILLNLYVNAVEAMPEGGNLFLKTMNVTDKDMSGKPYKANPGNYALLTVRDTGIGMDKETRERIFEPFFTTKGLASGTGLGLASTYGIIKGHGGYVDVDSEKGKGTTFSIYLPATEEMIEQKNVLSDELVKGKGTVLLVDDEEMVLEVGKELLDHLGYEVLLAENGQEALELYKKNQDKIDLVLLDMVMPVMGGGEAFDRMKEINTNVKVLLSSGYSLEGEAKEILKRGCNAFIQKPFKMEQLSQKLMEVLDKK